jgi:hypothetical protein
VPSPKKPHKKELSWPTLKDEELLKFRIRDLELSIEGTPLEPRIQVLHQELEAKGLRFKPKVYLGDEWFSPEGMVAIAVPFYLAHPRLMTLEKAVMLEVEGGDPGYFMKLLRHEAGHCFDHAYRVSRRKQWRELFGSPEKDYNPETYRPRPYSRSYVRHLENWYAQAHPDEDFAETFATWLDPNSEWRKKYKDWPIAYKKLKYVDQLARELAERAPRGAKGYLPFSATNLKTSLEKYYTKRRREQAEQYPDFFDGDLKRIFTDDPALSKREHGAANFMKRHRKEIIDSVSYWTGERKFTINALVRRLIGRCEQLGLKVSRNEAHVTLEVASYLATLVTHYLFTGKFKRRV